MHEDEQIDDVGEAERDTRQQNREESHSFIDIKDYVNSVGQDFLFEHGHIFESCCTSKIYGQEADRQVDHCKCQQEGSNTLFVSLVK